MADDATELARGDSLPLGHQRRSAGSSPPSYTPAPYAFLTPPAQQDPRREWVSVVRRAVWPALFLGAIITGHWTIWIAIGIIATIVLTQVGGRTRKPPPY